MDGLRAPFVSHSPAPDFASGFFLASFASLRETFPFSIFSRQDAKGAKVFDPGARGLVIYWVLDAFGAIPFTPMA